MKGKARRESRRSCRRPLCTVYRSVSQSSTLRCNMHRLCVYLASEYDLDHREHAHIMYTSLGVTECISQSAISWPRRTSNLGTRTRAKLNLHPDASRKTPEVRHEALQVLGRATPLVRDCVVVNLSLFAAANRADELRHPQPRPTASTNNLRGH
jgi:hypothetical protein